MSEIAHRRYLWTAAGLESADGDDPLSLYSAEPEIAQTVLISLLSDRHIDPAPPGYNGDRRGWWADGLRSDGRSLGSRIWQFERGNVTTATLRGIEDAAREPLDELVSDGAIATYSVAASSLPRGVQLSVQVARDDGTQLRLALDRLWG